MDLRDPLGLPDLQDLEGLPDLLALLVPPDLALLEFQLGLPVPLDLPGLESSH